MTATLTVRSPRDEAAEADSDAPDLARIEAALAGRWSGIRAAARDRMLDPAMHRRDDLPLAEQRARVTAQLRLLLESGAVRLPFPAEFGGSDDAGGNLVAFEEIVTADPSLQIKAGVQWGLFASAILHLGTRPHHERFLADAIELRTLGSFAMTESGHGSDVASIRTRAEYDEATGEFVLDTPSRSAWKDYIGNAAIDARAAVVFAQLRTRGEDHGVHAFYVPIRDADGAFLPGVGGEDDGLKGGLNGVDNGRLHFSGVRVPREHLLNRYGDVAADGTYSSPIASQGRRFFTMLGTLVQGRVSLAGAANAGAKVALTTAIVHASRRRQFPGADGRERALLGYAEHRRRLLPRLAAVYAAAFTQEELLGDFHRVFTGEHDTDEARQDLETFAAAAKAEATRNALDTIQECREACGGAGFLAENRFGQLHADLDVYTTFEGDNTVLLQLVGKRLLTDFGHRLAAGGPAGAARVVGGAALAAAAGRAGLPALAERVADNGSSRRARLAVTDPGVQHALLVQRVEVAVAELAPRLRPTEDRAAGEARFDAAQHELIDAARAWGRLRQWEAFTRAVEAEPHGPTRALLAGLRDVFGLSAIERELGWYLLRGRIGRQRAAAVPRAIDRLLVDLRPHAVGLVRAFGYEQGHLRTALTA